MIDWLAQTIHGLTWWKVLFAAAFGVVTFVVSSAVVTFVLVRLPANYFHSSHAREFLAERHPALRMVGIVFKNLFGLVLIVVGFVMALPGVPGPGLLTMFLGVVLLDFPGKRELEARLVGQPHVFEAINKLRARFRKPPLMLDKME